MNIKYRLLALLCATTLASGCATTGGGDFINEQGLCFLATTATGTAVGAAVENDPGPMAIGAIVGGLIGHYMCDDGEEETVAASAATTEMDSDGDGVMDSADRCPGTPRGTRVDANGCPLDSDGDGVTDDKDQCPNTPRGTRVNSVGCPLPDGDGDGAADASDQCPDTPSGQKVDARGCHIIFSLEGVNFAYNSAELAPAATTKLNEAVAMLKENMDMNIRIEGHTDSRGTEEYNMNLSQRRADSVVKYLTDNGIAASRLSSVGRGEGSPTATNDTDEGRAQNRRVDFVIQ